MKYQILKNKVITDKILCNWIRCRKKAWLDLNEENSFKCWTAHRSLQLDHQYKSLYAFNPHKPVRGIKALKAGANGVIGFRLKGISPSGIKLEAHPPLLHKINGISKLGKFLYIPVVTKQGKRLTREHKLSLALYAFLLDQFQNTKLEYGLIISLVSNKIEVKKMTLTNQIKSELFQTLKKINKQLYSKNSPSLATDRKKCTICSWKNFCDKIAYEAEDLTEISGIGGKRKKILQEIGIYNLSELSLSNEDNLINKLNSHGDNQIKIIGQLIKQAKVQKKLLPEKVNQNIILPELNLAKGILIYDIESDPDVRHDYLHGFVTINRKADGSWAIEDATYDPILNLNNNSEELIWKKLKEKFISLPNFPILHYGETEVLSILRLARKFKESDKEIQKLKKKFIDIHARLRKSWVLPVKSYSLKEVSKWLNFQWSQKNASGAHALLNWRQYLEAENNNARKESKIKWILKYNQDDCFATWEIAKWILSKD